MDVPVSVSIVPVPESIVPVPVSTMLGFLSSVPVSVSGVRV